MLRLQGTYVRAARYGIVSACAVAMLIVASVAVAAPPGDRVRAQGSVDNGNGTVDSFSVHATSGPLGENPRGQVFVDAVFISRKNGVTTGNGTVLGDVRDGCVVVVGNRAAVLGKLRQPLTLNGPGTVEYVGVTLEDNGEGQLAPDRGEVFFLRAQFKDAFCTTGFFLSLATRPLADGYVEVVDELP